MLHAAVRQAVRRRPGRRLALTGDSGAGKSALVEAACADAAGLRVLRGQCDPLHTPRPLGPFRDLALPGLGRASVTADVLLSEVCEQVYAALRTEPTVLVVEDLHWVDAASVEVLRFLARRIESMPLAAAGHLPRHEIDPRHSARPLLGDFAALDGLDHARAARRSPSTA